MPEPTGRLDLSYYADRASRIGAQVQGLRDAVAQVHKVVIYLADQANGLTLALGGMTHPDASAVREQMGKTWSALQAVDMDIEATLHSMEAANARAQATVQVSHPDLFRRLSSGETAS